MHSHRTNHAELRLLLLWTRKLKMEVQILTRPKDLPLSKAQVSRKQRW